MKRAPTKKKGSVDKSNIGWIRYALTRIVTEEQLHGWFADLTSKEKLDYLRSLYPKEVETKGDSGLSVTFVLNGVRDSKTIQGQVINAALNPPIEDNEDDTD